MRDSHALFIEMNFKSLYGWYGAGAQNAEVDRSRCAGELACEIRDRLRIHLALVPLLDHGEIRAAGLPFLAALPAITGKVVRGRSQHVGRAAQEVAAAVAVEIDRVLDVGRRHELGLAE